MTDEIEERTQDEFDEKARTMMRLYSTHADDLEAGIAKSLRAQAASTREKVEKEISLWLFYEYFKQGSATIMDAIQDIANAIESGAYRQDKPKEE